MYQENEHGILHIESGMLIPKAEGNRHYNEYLAWLKEGNTPEQPPQPALAEVKAEKLRVLNVEVDRVLDEITAQYPHNEVVSWDKQEAEAKAFKADSTATTTFLDGLSAGRGIEKADLVEKVLAKSEAFAAYSSRILGRRQSLESQISSAETVGEVQAISIELGV